jgi:ubiquitin carboxyl-terminal hydrolase 4/11/15
VFDFEGELIDPGKYGTIEELGLSPTDLVIVEFKESTKPWAIKNPCVAAEGKCEGCYNVKVLDYPCVCKKASYCKERRKPNDEKYPITLPSIFSSAEDDDNIEPSRPLTQSQANKLKNEALTFKRYWEYYKETLVSDNSATLYLLSKRFGHFIIEILDG